MENFYILRVHQPGTENKCPNCGDSFTTNLLAVGGARGEPLCDLCAWEKDEVLAGVLCLCDMVAFSHAGSLLTMLTEGRTRRGPS